MEEETKKKKIWKKKNKQNKGTDDALSAGGETASQDKSNVSEQNHQSQYSGRASVQDNRVIQIAEDKGVRYANSGNGSVLAENERQDWLKKEARLQEMIKQLQHEKDIYIHKEAGLEMEILHLQSKKDSWHKKEATLGQKVSQLLQEKATLEQEEAYLQQKVKHLEGERAFWFEKENSGKELVASLNDDNTRLLVQVRELEESRKNLFQENQQVREDISVLQLQIQNIERSLPSAHSSLETRKGAAEGEDLNSQMEAACALVEKLIAENAELVEKVNELYIELDRRTFRSGVSSIVIPDSVDSSIDGTIHDPVSESSDMNAGSVESIKPLERAPEVGGHDVDYEYAAMARSSSETSMSGEIVQIPLHENEVQDLEAQALMSKENVVALTDAPLIGAPFRLISFVAKYVSGADLVNKNSDNPEQ
ncbi:hypothetical protein Ancab_014139 [Ancistrocladus abbreviatus]